jgi:hypothetical protein
MISKSWFSRSLLSHIQHEISDYRANEENEAIPKNSMLEIQFKIPIIKLKFRVKPTKQYSQS